MSFIIVSIGGDALLFNLGCTFAVLLDTLPELNLGNGTPPAMFVVLAADGPALVLRATPGWALPDGVVIGSERAGLLLTPEEGAIEFAMSIEPLRKVGLELAIGRSVGERVRDVMLISMLVVPFFWSRMSRWA